MFQVGEYKAYKARKKKRAVQKDSIHPTACLHAAGNPGLSKESTEAVYCDGMIHLQDDEQVKNNSMHHFSG